MFQNSYLGCLYVHSSTTPNRVFLKPSFEGVTGHPQNTLTSGRMSLRVIFLFMKYITIPDSVAKQKNQHILLLLYYSAIRGEKIALYFFHYLISIEVLIF